MPKTYYTESGDAVEVPEEEEIKTKVAAEYEAKLKDAEAKVNELENEPVGKNFKLLREQAKKASSEAEELRKKLNEVGHPVNQPVNDLEQVRAEAQKVARAEILNETIEDALSQYDETTKPVVEHYFKKLTAGEELNARSVKKFLSDAETLAMPNAPRDPLKRAIGATGRVPRTEKPRYSDTADGKALAAKLNIE